MRYFIQLSYLGTAYCGWQRQQNGLSVQQAVEERLSMILRSPTTITGAGRTDTGVHASFYVAHFDSDTPFDAADLVYHLNRILPADIGVNRIFRVADSAHARFDAVERQYTYRIIYGKNPFERLTAWQMNNRLDVDLMNVAAQSLVESTDFKSFAKLGSDNRTTICHLTRAEWIESTDGCTFTIVADRFLRNMVRSIVGTLVDVGRGKISPERFASIVAARDLSLSSSSAPAQGLFLSHIGYSEKIFDPEK